MRSYEENHEKNIQIIVEKEVYQLVKNLRIMKKEGVLFLFKKFYF
jgi:hypothetical protein